MSGKKLITKKLNQKTCSFSIKALIRKRFLGIHLLETLDFQRNSIKRMLD